MSNERDLSGIHCLLAMIKVCARWAPRNLTQHDSFQRYQSSEEMLLVYNQNIDLYSDRDETLVPLYLETELESMIRKHKGLSTHIKFRTQA